MRIRGHVLLALMIFMSQQITIVSAMAVEAQYDLFDASSTDRMYSREMRTEADQPKLSWNYEPIVDARELGEEVFILSFAGDCTLGAEHSRQSSSNSFLRIVGGNYYYPFAYARPFFTNDDFTLVNLEGVFTLSKNARKKAFRFKAQPRYAKILSAGGIEAVTLTNNHSHDYGKIGYEDTKTVLDAEGIAYVSFEESLLVATNRGLSIGVYGGYALGIEEKAVQAGVADLKQRGADVIIAAFHWGQEGSYHFNSKQERIARIAIDAGADMVVGHHPHVLQPLCQYKGKPIAYSMGNFSFGGNTHPKDQDTVIIQQEVIRKVSGKIKMGKTKLIPFCLSHTEKFNDYQPVPYAYNSIGYLRTLRKLSALE